MKKRLLSLLLALVLVVGLLPAAAFAADETTTGAEKKVTVSFTSQAESTFLHAPQLNVEVSSNLAESYGYTDRVTDGVSALDVLVKAHEVIFESDFTAETKSKYLVASDGSISKLFGVETGSCGFLINHAQPHDDIFNETYDAYGAYAVDQARVNDGDFVEFCIYQTTYGATDFYVWFVQNGEKAHEFSAIAGAALELEAEGYVIGYYGSSSETVIDKNIENTKEYSHLEGAKAAWVDAKTGELTDIEPAALIDEYSVLSLTAPKTAGTYYLTVYMPEDESIKITMPLVPVTVIGANAAITVPNDAALFVGSKTKHFVAFTEAEPVGTVDNGDGSSTYYYDLKNGTYNYRVSGGEYVTYAGKFTKSAADYTLTVSDTELKPEGKTKSTIDRDVTANNGYNVADIYLNINPQNYLKLETGATYQLVNLRNWEVTDSVTGNYFIEPDYHYTVLNENGTAGDGVVTVSESGLITAVGNGTAIVLVTYDALQYAGAAGGPFFGAIWPENTGVFVVSVGAGDSGINTGMTINAGKNTTEAKLSGDAPDAEHDVIYFTGDNGSYTFTPVTKGCSVSVANPTVAEEMSFSGFAPVGVNSDGSFTVPLVNGRNIVKVSKDGRAEYQVITAKKVMVTVPESVAPGEAVSVSFDTLYHPANKLAGVYNMSAVAVYTEVDGYKGKLVGGGSAQYNFAANGTAKSPSQTVGYELTKTATAWSASYKTGAEIKIPEDWAEETFTFSGGSIISVGFGDPYGNHRGITLEYGKDPNFNAAIREAYLGILPDITVPVTLSKSVTALTVTAQPTKAEYYVGDSFDPAGMVVHAAYSDDTESDISSYTVSPQVLAENTTAVTVSYGGKSVEVPVTVIPPALIGLAVTTPPAKTAYTEGDVFNPSGMIVTASYDNGKTAAVSDYELEPKRALQETDTQITVKLGDLTATTPITVTAANAPNPERPADITVKFTLLGDEAHGEPESDETTHTLKQGNLAVWIMETEITVSPNAKVIDVIARALGLAGIPYECADGNYISSVRGLGEFTNGSLSGWMYTLNGSHSALGVAEQSVKNGDRIVFHYTDDYTQERTTEQGGGSSGGAVSKNTKVEVTIEKGAEGENAAKVELPKNVASAVAVIPLAELGSGNVLVIVNADGSETVVKKAVLENETAYAWLNKSCIVKLRNNSKSFADTENHWAKEAVEFVSSRELFSGTAANTFAPDTAMSRAMLAAVIYRLEDAETGGSNPFADVAADTWYTDAVTWANANNIVNGTGKGFEPNRNITRQELVVMLYRYAESIGMDTSRTVGISQYADCDDVASWANDAMGWAVANGLINGRTASTLAPNGTATRAEVAAIMQRLITLMVK